MIPTSYLNMNFTAGPSGNFLVQISNPTDEAITTKLDFFDQTITNDGENNKACSLIHTSTDFGSNLIWDTGSFSVPANSGVIKTINLNYDYCYSGPSLGCLVQMPDVDVNL